MITTKDTVAMIPTSYLVKEAWNLLDKAVVYYRGRAVEESLIAEQERQQRQRTEQEVPALKATLRELGIDPDRLK
ncbi:hypothetical protein [Leptodesmis sp.]|uniref:hypothetical protein n=1 Tax=Leptodesmis sp. TaxID=3100501 RepID=UPI0040534C37